MRTAEICPTCATYTNALCIIYDGPYLSNIDVSPLDNLEDVLGNINSNLVPVVGTTAPTQNAVYLGQLYINSTNGYIYYATDTGTGVDDWEQLYTSIPGSQGIDTVLAQNQPLTTYRYINVDGNSLGIKTLSYPNDIFTVQDGVVLIGDTGGDGNGTLFSVDDLLQTITFSTSNYVQILGNLNNTSFIFNDVTENIEITATNGVKINSKDVVLSVNSNVADSAGEITLPPFTLQEILDNNHDLSNGNNFQGTNAGFGNVGADVAGFGTGAAVGNSGNDVNAFGNGAGVNNGNNSINLFGKNAQADNDNQTVFASSGGQMVRIDYNAPTSDVKITLPDADLNFSTAFTGTRVIGGETYTWQNGILVSIV